MARNIPTSLSLLSQLALCEPFSCAPMPLSPANATQHKPNPRAHNRILPRTSDHHAGTSGSSADSTFLFDMQWGVGNRMGVLRLS